jgi:hypothetical protein
MCPDGKRWTREERDEWRRQVKAEDPSIIFVDTYAADRISRPRP